MRGPKSLAGLIAYPVGPPKDRPMARINTPTTIGFNPSVNSFVPMNSKPKTKINVPIISVIKLAKGFFIAGIVANTRSEEHTSELQSRGHLVCRLLLEKKKTARCQATEAHDR